jgi:ATP-binding cassette subfamily G (WHITE) protein 2
MNELQGLELTCTSAELASSPGGVCPVTSGEQTIDRLGLGELSIAANAAVLLAFIVVCRVVAYLGIRFLKW